MKHEPYDDGPFVEAWLKEPTWLPQTDLARVQQLVHQTPQRHVWVPRIGNMRFMTMISATTIAAGVAVIALTSGTFVNGLLPNGSPAKQLPVAAEETTGPADPTPATVTATPDATKSDRTGLVLPEILPPGVEGGTIDTATGPARWIHTSGSSGEFPRLEAALPWPGGVAAWSRDWSRDGQEVSLHATTNGIDWELIPLPGDLVVRAQKDWGISMVHGGSVNYLEQPRLGKLWRLSEEGEWVLLDASAFEELRPRGWSVSDVSIDGPELIDGEHVFRVGYQYRLPRQQLGLTRKVATNALVRLTSDRYALCNPDKNDCSADGAPRVLRFKETNEGLVVRDDRTDERLGLLAGANASELYSGTGASRRQAFVVAGDALVPTSWPASDPVDPAAAVPPPDVPADARAWSIGGRWLAVVPGSPDGGRTLDTRIWLHIGGVWVDLAEIGLRGTRGFGYLANVSGIGNTTLLWATDSEEDPFDLWLLTAPEGA